MIMMYLLFFISLIFCRVFAGYDSRFHNGKYVVIRNPKLRMLLMDETSFFETKKRLKKDINKITIFGVILYIFSLLTLVVSTLLLFLVPETMVEPWEIETNRFFMYVDTLNEKLAAICIWFFFLFIILCVAIRMIYYAKTIEQKWIKILTYIVSCVMIIAVALFLFEIIQELIICFV